MNDSSRLPKDTFPPGSHFVGFENVVISLFLIGSLEKSSYMLFKFSFTSTI
jgi:hypothetical protein